MKMCVQMALAITCVLVSLSVAECATNTLALQQAGAVESGALPGGGNNARRGGQYGRQARTAERRFLWSLQAGAGYWMGDSTFSIGGEAWTPDDGSTQLPEKISELKFPIDVAYGAIDGKLLWKGRIEVCFSLGGNLSQPSSKMEDSDWGVLEGSGSETLDVYSESDAELTAYCADIGARYWFRGLGATNRVAWSVGVGPSLMYRNFDWTVSDVEQWYPSHPEYGVDTVAGVVGTYNVEVILPCFDVCVLLKRGRVSGRAELGVGPAIVTDEDDHILRNKRSTADMIGIGAKAAAEVRCNLSRRLFAVAQVNGLYVSASGTSTQEGYGGDMIGYYAEIEEEFTLTSVSGGVALGYGF